MAKRKLSEIIGDGKTCVTWESDKEMDRLLEILEWEGIPVESVEVIE